MTYEQTLEWMSAQLPIYQLQGASAYKANLDNGILLANHLGNPENKLNFIHVAGTNGKGSTSHLMASALQEAGYNVGLYTSPHLKDFRERIKINGDEISQQYVVSFIQKHKSFFEQHQLSFFEMTVGLAFSYFIDSNVDIAIIEVGLGGRLDATNIITPLLSVITNIGLDHTQFLGNTLDKIAGEKAGIIKNNVPVVIGQTTPETKSVFITKAAETNSEIVFASETQENYESDLLGSYQLHNKKTALTALRKLQQVSDFKISENQIKKGFLSTRINTGLRGRWDQIGKNPTVICDTAHNADGLTSVLNQVESLKYGSLHIVLGVVNDKDLEKILPLFPKNAKYYFCSPNNSRGLPPEKLQQQAVRFSLVGEIYNSVSDAYQNALLSAATTDFILICGSTFIVAEVL